jgi:glucose/arabinose dehydrogenase
MLSVVAALAVAALGNGSATAAPVADVVSLGTFDHPLYVAVAPGQPTLLFVVEQPGRIQVMQNEVKLPQPFLDITDIVNFNDGERGLLSIAFPPDYGTSGRFFVAFNNSTGDIELDEFQRMAGSTVLADKSTRRIVLTIEHRGAANHNGGQLQFGPQDNMLYMSTGDGGALTPRGWPAPDLHNLLGKILRIKPYQNNSFPYSVPWTNPFRHRDARPEIFAYGFRNPWRFSFDDKYMIIADVGQAVQEEINFLRTRDVSGKNFGWPQYEGTRLNDNSQPGADPPTFPMFTYDHSNDRCAVIGGYVVHDPNIPVLANRYIYGDLCTGEVRTFSPRVTTQQVKTDSGTGIVLPQLSGFGRGFNGTIYLTQITGGVWRLVARQ